MIFILRITYANFAYALLQRLRGPVYAWQIQLPAALAAPFLRLRPHRLFDRDQWMLLHERAFDIWRDSVLPELTRNRRLTDRCNGLDVDLDRNFLQHVARDFERLVVFAGIVQRVARNSGARLILPWIGAALDRGVLQGEFPGIAFRRSFVNDLGERLYEWSLSAAHLARTVLECARSFLSPSVDCGPRRILWTGISPQEIPEAPDKLHFGWAAAYGSVRGEEVLYVLPARPGKRSVRFLQSQGIAAVAASDLFSLLSPLARLRALASSGIGFLRGLLLDGAAAGPLRARFMARVPLWLAIARRLGSRVYVTSSSASWPERPEVAALQAAGLRTAIWSYSANLLWFAKSARDFRDVGVTRSVMVSDEIWVWNHAVRRYYERRRASRALPAPRIRVTGAMMCGDPSIATMTPGEARARLGIARDGFCISVFDVPTVNDAWRERFGGGPVTIEPDFSEAFFHGLKALLQRYPEVRLILKLKRQLNDRHRHFPAVLFELIAPDGPWMRDGRIRLADVNCDPWLPVAAGDACLGMPCTSLVLMAIASGRPAAYYDPLRVLGRTPEDGLRTLALRTQEELESAVGRWLAGERPVPNTIPELALGPEWRTDPHMFEAEPERRGG